MRLTVTRDFEEADLVQIVKALAKEMGRNAYIGPGVDGKLSINFQGVPPEAALASVLKMQPKPIAYKLIGRTVLVVASPDKLSQIESEIIECNFSARPSQTGTDRTRREFLLNHAIAPALLPKLRAAYPALEFSPHVLNGFYAVGTRQELARLGKAIPDIDIEPEDLTEEFYELEYQPVGELKPLLESLVPTLSTKPDPDDSATLVLRGIPEDVELGVALLDQLGAVDN